MSETPSSWSENEFKAYLLLYCAHADFIEKEEEKELIKSKVSDQTYEKIYKEFDADGDFQRTQKITNHITSKNLSEKQIEELINEINAIFASDGDYSALEKSIFYGLKRILTP